MHTLKGQTQRSIGSHGSLTRQMCPSYDWHPRPLQWSNPSRRLSMHAAPSSVPTATDAAALRPSESAVNKRHYPSALPPTGDKVTNLIRVKDGLWCLQQEFGAKGAWSIFLSSFVAQLSTGGLLVVTPIAPTQEVLDHLATLPGTVEHIIIPNKSPEHWAYAPAFAQHFPGVRIWCVTGLLESTFAPGPLQEALVALKAYPLAAPVQPHLLEALPEDVDVAEFTSHFGLLEELAVYLKRYQAVGFADMCFGGWNDEGMPLPPSRWIARVVGIYRRLGSPIGLAAMMLDRTKGRAWASKVLSWDFDTILMSHLTPAITEDVQKEFMRCFDFVLRPASKDLN